MVKFEDQKLTCEDCGTEFVWDASEQAFCRAKKQIEMDKEKAKEKEVTCAKCGKKGVIKEDLSPEEEALCMECYLKESQG